MTKEVRYESRFVRVKMVGRVSRPDPDGKKEEEFRVFIFLVNGFSFWLREPKGKGTFIEADDRIFVDFNPTNPAGDFVSGIFVMWLSKEGPWGGFCITEENIISCGK